MWWHVVLAIGSVLGYLCLLAGMLLTMALLEDAKLSDLWPGVGLLLAGAVLCAVLPRQSDSASGGEEGRAPGVLVDPAMEVVILQVISVILILAIFGAMLDGGRHLRAGLYSYFCYAPGMLVVLARRSRALSKGDVLYLKWGWVVFLTVGVPYFTTGLPALVRWWIASR